MGLPHIVVAAERLNTDDLLTSIKTGRTWISAATTVDLSFMATFDDQCAQIGDELDTHGKSATVQATVHGVPFGPLVGDLRPLTFGDRCATLVTLGADRRPTPTAKGAE